MQTRIKKQENGSTIANKQCIISGIEGKCRGMNIHTAHRA